MKPSVLFAVVTLLLTGCQPRLIRLNDVHTEDQIRPSDIVPIAINPVESHRIDIHTWWGTHTPVETGPIWQRVFVGTPGVNPELEIVAVNFGETITAAGFAARTNYTVDSKLVMSDGTRPIHAEGTCAWAIDMTAALKEAVELGVADTAHQAMAILNARSPGTDQKRPP